MTRIDSEERGLEPSSPSGPARGPSDQPAWVTRVARVSRADHVTELASDILAAWVL